MLGVDAQVDFCRSYFHILFKIEGVSIILINFMLYL
jgi:hypothetical protein